MLRATYPEFDWEPWRFARGGSPALHCYWQNEGNMMAAIERAEQALGIQEVGTYFFDEKY